MAWTTCCTTYIVLRNLQKNYGSSWKKYKTKDVGTKKFIVGKFLDCKMVYSKTILSQAKELQVILHEIHMENMSLSKSFQVAAIIERFSPMWRYFKNYLKHKLKEMNIEELVVQLRIEEDNRSLDKYVGNHIPQAKANVVESNNKSKKRKRFVEPLKKNEKKFKGNYYNCVKAGHHSVDYHKPRKQAQANITEYDTISNGIFDMNLSTVVSECNNIRKPMESWVDMGVTSHIYSDKWMFTSYTLIEGENCLWGTPQLQKLKDYAK